MERIRGSSGGPAGGGGGGGGGQFGQPGLQGGEAERQKSEEAEAPREKSEEAGRGDRRPERPERPAESLPPAPADLIKQEIDCGMRDCQRTFSVFIRAVIASGEKCLMNTLVCSCQIVSLFELFASFYYVSSVMLYTSYCFYMSGNLIYNLSRQ